MTSTIGIPIKLLNEATGHQVTVEIDSGQTYRGKLVEAEDNMNCQLENINVTQRDGRVTHLDRVYIRGSTPSTTSPSAKMDIKHSRRILCLGPPNSKVLDVIGDLTGSAPSPHENGSTAGLTHEWEIKNAYYSARVPIWVDEISNVAEWKDEFLKPEAKEVVEAVGAWVYCFPKSANTYAQEGIEGVMKAIQEVVEKHTEDLGMESLLLAVAVPEPGEVSHPAGAEPSHDDWEDLCLPYGFEYIDYAAKGKNEYGENTGFERLKEALEANDWSAPDPEADDIGLNDLGLDDDDDDEETLAGMGRREEAEMTAELFGMKTALMQEEEEEEGHGFEPDAEDFMMPKQQAAEVENLDRMMGRLMAVKEQSADLPEGQRKRMAAQAVRQLMNDG
ncbi:hypothetical protein BTJ68_12074 [Hortaea werneckii EXF-2000]|uniref:Sm domain-containing protein n=2 Tax=Hortaea werneckii TaxID=91943 RepID=A0A1Z5ST31_HORWE|nr:hypothetical protein BTJ68_12074 [Hortaea werneckii EXF-2000]